MKAKTPTGKFHALPATTGHHFRATGTPQTL